MIFSVTQPLPATISAATAGSGADNVLTPDPREAFVGAAAGADLHLTVDLGAVTAIDTVFVGYTTAAAGAVVSVYPDGLAPLVGTIAHSWRRDPLRHAVLASPEPLAARHLEIVVPGGGGLCIGSVAAGLAIRPKGYEPGSGRPVSDPSRVERLFGGGFGVDRGVASGGWSWTMPLTDEERDRLYALALDAGIGSTVLVTEHAEAGVPGENEAIHWGLLAKLEPWNRQAPGETVWSMQVQDW